MEEFFPGLVLGGLSEADGVVLEGFPVYEEDVSVFVFDAFFEVVVDVAGHGGDDGLGFFEGGFELGGLVGDYVEDGYFEDHGVGLFLGHG